VGGPTCDPVHPFKSTTRSVLPQTSTPTFYPPAKMHFRVLKNVSTSLLEAYVEQVWKLSLFHLSMRLSHPQVFPIPLATWTPEIIRREDGPESFGLFTSYSLEYGVLQLFDNNSYEYCGPMDFCEDIVEAATKVDIVHYRRFVSKPPPRIISLAYG